MIELICNQLSRTAAQVPVCKAHKEGLAHLVLVLLTHHVTDGQNRFGPGSLGAIPGGLVGGLQPIAPLDPFSSNDGTVRGVNRQPGAGGGQQFTGPAGQLLAGSAPGSLGARGGPIDQRLGGPAAGTLGTRGSVVDPFSTSDEIPRGVSGQVRGPLDQRLGATAPGRLGVVVPPPPPQMSVELLLLVDNMAKEKWASKMPGSTPEIKQQNALAAMEQFLESVVHGVNELFDVVDHVNASKPTTGVAYKGVMCKFGSISVIENSFTFQMVHDMAHELGHRQGKT
ncbi:hypothetical protein EGW08_011953 [Elysia chlorotica]|uniref:Peptidase M12B domain-containing protein n=1 Tax=Elysia chlorotica TaxID=188477 RepID=A0A3S1BBM1_ELYCH|nr:hypothetical protein EGW08_011953 [Elysia chlorotica]